MGDLTQLESLDPSKNKISGEISGQLTGLTFLAVLYLSHNNLTGAIPQGKQFDTFQNTSFEGNLELCGFPLSKKCVYANAHTPQPATLQQGRDSESATKFDWKVMFMGYGCGILIGFVTGCVILKIEWFPNNHGIRTFGFSRGTG